MNNDLNSAFPWVSQGAVSAHQIVEAGLSKREYFAALALAGMNANPAHAEKDHDFLAGLAVKDADALINALSDGRS